MESPDHLTRNEFVEFLQSQMRLDDYIVAAMDVAEEIHGNIKREDHKSSFLETHTWPVARDIIKHYRNVKRNITSFEVVAGLLHDILEDNEKILNLYRTKEYDFDAYLRYRFGTRIYNICTDLKIKPLENFSGKNDEDRQVQRFHEYCNILSSAEYDVKTIKLADRVNNMMFMADLNDHDNKFVIDKIKRYLYEAEDFYFAYALLDPAMEDFYKGLRTAYDQLKTSNVGKVNKRK
ncbi:MAG: HD domain-containing protein [Nitrososphaeraceae archaeon]